VLTRQHGRAYNAAQNAFTKVEKFCAMIAEASQQPEKQEQTVPDAEAASSPEDVPSETPPKEDDQQPEKQKQTAPDAEAASSPEDVPSETPPKEDDQQPEKQEQTVLDAEATSSPEDVSSETPLKEDDQQPDNLAENGPAASEDTTRGAEGVDDKPQEQEKETSQSAEQTQAQDSDNNLPSCGNCKGPLSFPCWYCVKCEGQLSSDTLHILGAVS
jgi:hypothetical protein